MRITWPVSSILLLTVPLACSTTATLETEAQTSTGDADDDDGANTFNGQPTTANDASTTGNGTTLDVTSLPPFDTTADSTVASLDTGTTLESTASATDTEVDPDTTMTGDESTTTGDPPPPSCQDGQKSGGETDLDCGGPDCAPCDDGQSCSDGADCSSSVCTDTVCAAPSCSDGAKNQDESDVDCGGSCPLCLDGESCGDSGDCESGVCDADICQVPTCEDNSFNQDETDVDCGGATCSACGDGKACELAADCTSSVCAANVCAVPSCTDGAQNQDETDVDCGGATCAACKLDHLVINEVDYDQPNDDTTEFIEIFNNTGLPVSLVGVKVVLVNGMNNATYASIDLTNQVSLAHGQYLVVANPNVVVPDGALKVNLNINTIQNGAPDGIALVDTVAVKLLDALSYEGSITSANVTGLGMGINLVEGEAFTTADAGNGMQSLARFPNGNDKNNAKTDWVLSKNPTPGAANVQ